MRPLAAGSLTHVSKRGVLIMVGGGDTFVEDLYGYIGPPALALYRLLAPAAAPPIDGQVEFPTSVQDWVVLFQVHTPLDTPLVVPAQSCAPVPAPQRLAASAAVPLLVGQVELPTCCDQLPPYGPLLVQE
jgi:hypothetical protein